MNVIDDIKDKISGGSNSSRSLDSDLDNSINDSGGMDDLGSPGTDNSGPGLDSGLGNQQNNSPPTNNNSSNGQHPGGRQNQNSPTQKNLNNNQSRNNSGKSNRNQQRNNNTNNQRGQRSNSTPNPQTGRPQPGQNSPQLSNNTKKEMQNAGMDPSNPQSVSNQSSDLQEIKRQNEQIIDLLKRLNQTLSNI